MPIILRVCLLLAATAAILVAMLGSGVLTEGQITAAEQAVAGDYQQQALLLRGQVLANQMNTLVDTLPAGPRAARDQVLAGRRQLTQLAGTFRDTQGNDRDEAAGYSAAVTLCVAALDTVLAGAERGDTRATRAALPAFHKASQALTTALEALLLQETGDLDRAQAALAAARVQATWERTAAMGIGLLLLGMVAWISFRHTAQPLIALARQARQASVQPTAASTEFKLAGGAPSEARQLAAALNSLVAQLREKYLDLERANAELHERTAEAQSASQAKTVFVANMSHELRTPLNAIIGFSEMLAEGVYGPLSEPQRQQLERVLRNSEHLLTLINDVLDLSRVESGKVSLELRSVEPAVLAGTVVAAVEPLARQKGLTLQLVAPSGLPVLMTDEDRLRQVLLNLLMNALKFTPQGGVTLTIALDPALPRWLLFRVSDTGIGIPPGDLDHIWEEFHQLSAGLSRTVGGSGLGLAIVRKLIDLLGGDVEVVSQPGSGSTFTVYLPLAPSESRDGAAGASLYAATGSFVAAKRPARA